MLKVLSLVIKDREPSTWLSKQLGQNSVSGIYLLLDKVITMTKLITAMMTVNLVYEKVTLAT